MQKYFRCIHCSKLTRFNPRLKGNQLYCGNRACQQARKNKWEKDKLQKDKSYNTRRKNQKAKWRSNKPCDQYQKQYRESHPQYVITNRDKQRTRNKSRRVLPKASTGQKIVKTDALHPGSLLPGGLYLLQPYCPGTTEKIVKTDALIVALESYQGLQGQEPSKTLRL